MTNQEAIQYIRNAAWLGANEHRDKIEEAVEMAVEALKAQDVARERYEDLCEYFNNNPHTIEFVLNDRKEFKAWLERMYWHVLECDKLARKLEALEDKDTNVTSNDTISRQMAVKEAKELYDMGDCYCDRASMIGMLNSLPPAQPEQSAQIQDILQFLDERLHPIISPEHWNVYSELHDMISMLPSAQQERPEQPESAKEYCAECNHNEVCRWYPYEGCEFRSLPSAQLDIEEKLDDAYAHGYSDAESKYRALMDKDGDTVSRQAAIDAIKALWNDAPSAQHVSAMFDCEDAIRVLPSAQPDRPKGEWINDGDYYICSECQSVYGWWADSQVSNFCPNCGADMRGKQNE